MKLFDTLSCFIVLLWYELHCIVHGLSFWFNTKPTCFFKVSVETSIIYSSINQVDVSVDNINFRLVFVLYVL